MGIDVACNRNLHLALVDRTQGLSKVVALSTFGPTYVEEALQRVPNATDEVGGDTCDPLSHLEGLFESLNVGERSGFGTSVVAGETCLEKGRDEQTKESLRVISAESRKNGEWTMLLVM